jgi:hypothetical protein
VRNIAFSRGIVTIKDIDLDDGVWRSSAAIPTPRSRYGSMPGAAPSSR